MIAEMAAVGWLYYFAFVLFMLIANLTVLNMLTGCLCEVVAGVSQDEKEDMEVRDLQQKLFGFLQHMGDAEVVDRPLFVRLLSTDEAAKTLDELGVDVLGLVNAADFIFREGQEVKQKDEIAEIVLQFRGAHIATV